MRTSPETIILAVALVLLLLGAAGMAYLYPDLADLTGVKTTQPSPHSPPVLHAENVQASLAAWSSPALWPELSPDHNARHYLFISEPYLFYPALYPTGKYIQKDDGTAVSNGGVRLSWYRKYRLDFRTADVDRQDPDGDGFSNIVEYKNEKPGERLKAIDCDGTKSTNPLDPQSHPSYLARLRLDKYESRPFHIEFRGYQEINGVYQFQLFLSDVPSDQQPRLKKKGDPLGFENYTVGEFHLNIVNEKDKATGIVTPVDESTLDLLKTDIDFKVTLVFRKEVDAPESTADFVMLMPSQIGQEIKAPLAKPFSIPFIPNKQYRLVNVNDNGATIRDTDPANPQNIPVLKLDPADWDEVPVPKSP